MVDEAAEESGTGQASKETIENEVIVLDYGSLQNKRFVKCKIVYRGGRPPILIGNEFVDCKFIFEGQALNTVQFLAGLAQGGGSELVLKQLLGAKP